MDPCGCDWTRRRGVGRRPDWQYGAGSASLVVATAGQGGGDGSRRAFSLDGASGAGVWASGAGSQPTAIAIDLRGRQQTRSAGRKEPGTAGESGLAFAEADRAPVGGRAGGLGADRGAGSAG